MKIALVHDDLVQWGGAERMLAGLSEVFPDAPIYTSVFDYDNPNLAENFKDKKIVTSFLQKIPLWRSLYKTFLPLYPLAFEQFDFDSFDLVISQSTRFAKSIITKPGTKHICYCHTPPRFLWDTSLGRYEFIELFLSYLRIYDSVSATRVDQFIAGSKNARKRIRKIYKKDSFVVYPYVDIDRFSRLESFDGGYFLVITRLNKYKSIDLAITACAKLNLPLKIIGKGPELNRLKKMADILKAKVNFLGNLPDYMVSEVMAGARALIVCGKEDFGITALEAQALGKPVVAYGKGGVLESVIPGKTGFFFANQTTESLMEVLTNKSLYKINPAACRINTELFKKEKFMTEFKKQFEGIF